MAAEAGDETTAKMILHEAGLTPYDSDSPGYCFCYDTLGNRYEVSRRAPLPLLQFTIIVRIILSLRSSLCCSRCCFHPTPLMPRRSLPLLGSDVCAVRASQFD